MEIKIVDYSKMSLKELEKEHFEQNKVLLEMISANKYSLRDIEIQKCRVDGIYKKICEKYRKISKMRG